MYCNVHITRRITSDFMWNILYMDVHPWLYIRQHYTDKTKLHSEIQNKHYKPYSLQYLEYCRLMWLCVKKPMKRCFMGWAPHSWDLHGSFFLSFFCCCWCFAGGRSSCSCWCDQRNCTWKAVRGQGVPYWYVKIFQD